jgi:SIT4-associating protein SAP185/190
VTYLSRKDSVKALLTWVTSGLDTLDAASASAGADALKRAKASDARPAFREARERERERERETHPDEDAVMAEPEEDKDKEDAAAEDEDEEMNPNLPVLGIGLGEGLSTGSDAGAPFESRRDKYPQVAAEILTSELWTIPETIMSNKDALLIPFWNAVLPPIAGGSAAQAHSESTAAWEKHERERAHQLFWTEEDEERERKREIVRGLWMRVNNSLLQKRTTEMIRFIQAQPDIIARMVASIESPAVQDMLSRIIQAEETVPDVMGWLGEQRLIPRLLALLSPDHPPSTHAIVADLIKSIISVTAPNSSFNPHGGNVMDQTNGVSGHKDNRLVRELTSRESIATLVGYMLDVGQLSDSGTEISAPADLFVAHEVPSIASATSSLCYACNVIVEVIRRNNSDLAEPYLFNTMRNRLMAIQSESLLADESESEGDADTDSDGDKAGDALRIKLEASLPALAQKLAIVHLGALVVGITSRFGELHALLATPRSAARVRAIPTSAPLTMERFRIIELYAELLHSSNMATLNRIPGAGPEYDEQGALVGGLDGLHKLGDTLQAPEDKEPAAPAPGKESAASTDISLTESDDVPLSDDEGEEKKEEKEVKEEQGEGAGEMEAEEKAADSTAEAVDAESTPASAPAEILSTGECLKHKFIEYHVLPTLLDLFFEHANNNFLHHLVYDVLQQILNGQLGAGYNRALIIELFGPARLVHRVLDAQRRNDAAVAKGKPRLSYMGHISLIAEELVKFFARAPADLASQLECPADQWAAFVDGALRETRARDTQPLAGGKPPSGLSAPLGDRSDSESSDDDDEAPPSVHVIGEPLSRISGKQADNYADDDGDGGDDDRQMQQFWRPSNSRSGGMDSSDDDDDDADWLRPTRDDDEFGGFQSSAKDEFDDDDAWGSFTSVGTTGENPFGDEFVPTTSTSASASASGTAAADAFRSAEPLTPRDWAEAFDREFDTVKQPWAEDADEDATAMATGESEAPPPSIVMPDADTSADDDEIDVGVRAGVVTPGSGWSFPGSGSGDSDLGEDLPAAPASEIEGVQRRAAGMSLGIDAETASKGDNHGHGEQTAAEEEEKEIEREDALANAATIDEPLGPGVGSDTHVAGGMLERTMSDGSVVRVPEDDIVRGVEEAIERRLDE